MGEPVDWHKRDEFIDLLAEVERLREIVRGLANAYATGRPLSDDLHREVKEAISSWT